MSNTDWLLRASAVAKTDEEILISSSAWNGLVGVDVNTFKARFIDSFPDEQFHVIWQHFSSAQTDNYVVFFPQYGNFIHRYDKKSKTIVSFPFPHKGFPCVGNVVEFKDSIMVFPVSSMDPFYIFFPDNGKTVPVDNYDVSNVEKERTGPRTNVIKIGDDYLFAWWGSEYILNWNSKTGIIEKYDTGIQRIEALYYIDKNIWIIEQNSDSIWNWSKEAGSRCVYRGKGAGGSLKPGKYGYFEPLKFSDSIVFKPAFCRNVLCYKNKQFSVVYDFSKDKDAIVEAEWALYAKHLIIDDKLWLFPSGADGVLIFDNNMQLVDKRRLYISDEDSKRKIYERIKLDRCILSEGHGFSLKQLIEMV